MHKLVYIFIAICGLISCQSKFEMDKYEISKIDVFYIPFDINSPIQSDENSIRKLPNSTISDFKTIEKIKKEIDVSEELSFGKKINKNNIYLICDFYDKKNKVFTLMFDKNIININDKNYNENQTLIDLLIKNSTAVK